MTVKDLSRLTNINSSTLYSIIKRDTPVRYDFALKIANTLDIDINLICKDNPYKEGEEIPGLFSERFEWFTRMNKNIFQANIIDELIQLYDYQDFPKIFRLLALYYQLDDTGREQTFDILEGIKVRHTDPERKEKLREIKQIKIL